MGIFSNNETSLGNYEVVAKEGYLPSFGGPLIMMESAINEERMFNALIARDFAEAAAKVNGEAFDESFEVVTEGVADFGRKIKEMVIKVWEKIKGLFKSFLVKLQSVIMRDTKALFKKYNKEFYGNTGKLKKWKFAKPEKDMTVVNSMVNTIGQSWLSDSKNCIRNKALEKTIDAIDDGSMLDNILANVVPGTDRKSFAKDYHEFLFPDNETHTDEAVPTDIKKEIADTLQNNKAVTDIKKLQTTTDKTFKTILKNIDNTIRELVNERSTETDDNTSYSKKVSYSGASDAEDNTKLTIEGKGDNVMKKLNTLRSLTVVHQTAMNILISASLKETKWNIAQCRRVFGQIVSMRSSKNEAVLLDAIGEAAEFEIYDAFDNYEF